MHHWQRLDALLDLLCSLPRLSEVEEVAGDKSTDSKYIVDVGVLEKLVLVLVVYVALDGLEDEH